jgi:hypothetical protein
MGVPLQGGAWARAVLRLFGWRVACPGMPARQGVMIAWPHTSNWDFPVAMLARVAVGLPLTWWAKESLFRWPLFGTWIRSLGARPVGRHRGPQGMVGIERVMDHIAHALRQNPLAVRRTNFYRAAAVSVGGCLPPTPPEDIFEQKMDRGPGPANPAGAQTTHYHMPVEDFIGHDLVAALEASSDYAARRAGIAAWNAGSPVLTARLVASVADDPGA